jgi:hypothetical protein
MKKENPTTILLIAAIVVLAAIGAHYAGLFAVTGGSDCDDDFLQLGETLGLESTCAMYEVTVEEFSLNGYQVLVSLNLNGNMQSHTFSSGESKIFEPDGCDELWTITCDSIWANPQGAQFEICYESTYVCPTPTVTYPNSPEVTFDGKTATCRVTLDTQDGNAPKDVYGGSAVMGYNGDEWVWLLDQIDWTDPVQTVDLTWEMTAVTDYVSVFVILENSCGKGSGTIQTADYTYSPTPDVPCDGLPVCNEAIHTEERCCDGNPWSCRYIDIGGGVWDYRWEKWDTCGSDEVCSCVGVDCSCTASATGAKIDDNTDTITVDKSSYSSGDAVRMTATGTNIGGESWHGYILFYSTSPSGYTKEEYEYELTVAAGATESRIGHMTLPTNAEEGTWSIQSKWIDDNGVVHARSTTTLGSSEIDTDQIYIVIGVLLFILIVWAALKKRPQNKR